MFSLDENQVLAMGGGRREPSPTVYNLGGGLFTQKWDQMVVGGLGTLPHSLDQSRSFKI